MKYATPGSISSATLRQQDLLDAFSSKLEDLIQSNAEMWISDPDLRDEYVGLVWEARVVNPEKGPDAASDCLCALESALDDFAPEGHYFGAHPGDGADFGFWPLEED